MIRAATVADADAIGEIHVLVWQAAYAGLMPAGYLAGLSVERRQQDWRRRLRDDPQVLVAVEGHTAVGFASFGASRDDGAEPRTGELYAIYLHPDYWGRGLGDRLHARALAALRAAGFRRGTLWVLAENESARGFYEAAGWSADGATKVDSFDGSPELTEVRYTRLL